MGKLVIGIGFDGTIVKDKYPYIGGFKPFAKQVIKWLNKREHTLILWTCREGLTLEVARIFLESNGLYFDYYNRNSTETIEMYGNDCRKLGCDLLVDDKAGVVNWVWVFIKILLMELFV